jgi:hypothetical protein
MSEVKHLIAPVVIPDDTSPYVQSESYLLRYGSQHAWDNVSEI